MDYIQLSISQDSFENLQIRGGLPMDDSLFQVVYVNDLDTVRKLLDDPNVNINKMDRLGRTLYKLLVTLDFMRFARFSLRGGECR